MGEGQTMTTMGKKLNKVRNKVPQDAA
jgi:hypothetical protein